MLRSVNPIRLGKSAFPRSGCATLTALRLAVCAALTLSTGAAQAQSAPSSAIVQPIPSQTSEDASFRAYLDVVRSKALGEGVRSATIDAAFAGLTVNPRVIQLDQGEPTPANAPIPAFAPYRERHVDTARITRGRRAYVANRGRLASIEQQTGVPESVMVAIYGHETNYGSFVGDFDLVRSLATLAYEGRRRSLFEPELIAILKLLDRGIPRSTLVGSYAGATGYPQFLPSVYLRMARDGDGDGRADIWASEADALASIANYFVKSGWRAGQSWGIPVAVPAGLNTASLANRTVPPRCPRVFDRHSRWLTMAEWRALGVVPSGGRTLGDTVLATLLEPDGRGNTAYLLTSNYRAILDYNCSNFYALSVGLLADAVEQ